ncbi:hypothetical protein GGI35DRAFT_478931 [Trichoderma velutinum]
MALHMARIHLDVHICTTPSDLYQKGVARVTQLQAMDVFGIAYSRAFGGNMESRIPSGARAFPTDVLFSSRMLLDARAGASSPFTHGQQARSPPGEESNGMIRWSAKTTAHFFVAFQADGDKGEAEARI